MRYRVNSPQVISETVGGETIIVNLASGHYFSLQGTAVEVWDGVERGDGPKPSCTSSSNGTRPTGGDEINASVTKLLDDFVAAELLVAEKATKPTASPFRSSQAEGDRVPFVPPTFTTFTDMQDIILLDPVHEVDTQGWPHASAGA